MAMNDRRLLNFCLNNFLYKEGNLYRKIARSPRVKIGDIVGYQRGKKARVVVILGKEYRIHRLIFLMYHGYTPDLVRHKNKDIFDNRLANLEPTQFTNSLAFI